MSRTITLILIAMLIILLTRRGRPRLSREAQRGIRAAIQCYPTLPQRRAYRCFTASRDGVAVAVLLLNAAAKTEKHLYQYKVPLLRAVVGASHRSAWWMERHDHPMATSYTNTYAVFVETSIGPILDIQRVQLSVHISEPDASRYFAHAPAPAGRTWAGVYLQSRAEAIAHAFLDR